MSNRKMEPGDLTHIDLWGKYDVVSINGNQYYILFVDDNGRYTTINFLKKKDEAAQKVKGYVAYLKTQGKLHKVIRIDQSREFLNKQLEPW